MLIHGMDRQELGLFRRVLSNMVNYSHGVSMYLQCHTTFKVCVCCHTSV